MSFVVQGWCPGALRPMMSGDGLVVRVRPHMARLTPQQASGLARAALAHGNGLIDLTTRANLQLRGVRPEAHLTLLDDLDNLSLLDTDEAVEQHRNLVVSPFWAPGDGTEAVVTTVLRVLAAPEFSGLSGKFGISVDPALPVLQAVSADVRIERVERGWLVRPHGFLTGAVVQNVEAALRTLLRWFLAFGVKRMGQAVGHALPPGFDQLGPVAPFTAAPGLHSIGRLVSVAFGQMRAETLLAVADCPVRITPWRMILLEGVTALPDLSEFITDPDDPLLRVVACTGAPNCSQAFQSTRNIARALAPLVPLDQTLHVSGCPKGCAHLGPTDVTLMGTVSGFEVIRHGHATGQVYGPTSTSTDLFKAL